jgi:hypothetical protein
MSKAEHLPGPWFVAETDDNEGYPETVIRGMDGVAGVAVAIDFPKMPGVREANARLMAASPELLAAAHIALTYIEAVCFNTPNPKKRNNYADAASKIREAILKATEDQSHDVSH